MYFLLQLENKAKGYDIDVLFLKEVLDREKYIHQYSAHALSEFYDEDGMLLDKDSLPTYFENAIPIGTIDFITAWLNIFTNIKQENPIEIPPCLRTEEFLKRKYSIVTKDDIPTKGHYFIKDASQLKVFSYSGNLEWFFHDKIWETSKHFDTSIRLNPNHLFQVSEIVDIWSEYRVYIIAGEIYAIANYNGNPGIFPDVSLIKKANNIYSLQPDYPKSYTMDVMVTAKGTSIIECHILLSTGLYHALWDNNLAYGYRDAINYLLKHNTPPTEFNNFNDK